MNLKLTKIHDLPGNLAVGINCHYIRVLFLYIAKWTWLNWSDWRMDDQLGIKLTVQNESIIERKRPLWLISDFPVILRSRQPGSDLKHFALTGAIIAVDDYI